MSETLTDTPTESTDTPWWMSGNYAPITDELTLADVPVLGKLPAGLSGRYLRNGFNPRGKTPMHWFFGNGMVHGFEIRDGRVSYRNRYVHTPYLDDDMDVFSAIGDLRASPANTHIIEHGGRLLTLEEAHLPWEVDADLGTVGCFDYDGKLTTPMTAHPKLCPETGELLFFGYQFFTEPYLTYHRADPQGRLVQSEVIDIPRPVMMHDFNITRNHVVFMDLPIVFELEKGGFHFDRSVPGRLGVMPRTGSNADITWYEIEPCSVFHALNAFERDDEIVLQVCRQPSLMEQGMNDLGEQATLWKWTIDQAAGAVKEEQLDDRYGDFPRVDDRRVGLPARYGYLAQLHDATSPLSGNEIHKYDLQTGAVETHVLGGESVHTFEPVFAPAGPDAGEDEGWILVLAHDDATDVTALHVIEAQDFTADPVATVPLPQRIPFGAHGSWLPDAP